MGSPEEIASCCRLIADECGIDFESIRLTDGRSAWSLYESELVPKRNGFVHKGDPTPLELSLRAVECTEALFWGLLGQIAKKFQMGWPKSGAWHKPVVGTRGSFYKPCDPFQ